MKNQELIPPPMNGGTQPQPLKSKVSFQAIPAKKGSRIGIYGSAGIGKTTLAATAEGKKVFFDLDGSLPVLKEQMAPDVLSKIAVVSATSWQEMLDSLNADGWDGVRSIIIDTLTKAEELCVSHTLKTVPNDKGRFVQRLEDFGYGKGYVYLFDCFLPLLQAMDNHCREGRNVILIMHDCTATVPNPAGDDYLRYEPRLSSPASGKSSIRLRVREWLDHLLFIGYETTVDSDGKAKGGRRVITPIERPYCMAKSRLLQSESELNLNKNIINQIII